MCIRDSVFPSWILRQLESLQLLLKKLHRVACNKLHMKPRHYTNSTPSAVCWMTEAALRRKRGWLHRGGKGRYDKREKNVEDLDPRNVLNTNAADCRAKSKYSNCNRIKYSGNQAHRQHYEYTDCTVFWLLWDIWMSRIILRAWRLSVRL